jgi:hypothetical protein
MTFIDAPSFDEHARDKDGAHPRFFMDTRQNKFRSEAEGAPRFDEVEMVEILIPGDRLSTSVQIVNDSHRRRWPKAYAAFKEGQEAPVDGTPLDQLPGMTKARVEELRFFHVRSIEQLAGMPDDLLMKAAPMDGRALRDKAKRWVENAAGAAPAEKLAAENRALTEKMSVMETQMADMKRLMDGMQAQLAAAGAAPVAVPTGE